MSKFYDRLYGRFFVLQCYFKGLCFPENVAGYTERLKWGCVLTISKPYRGIWLKWEKNYEYPRVYEEEYNAI